uniref:BZIP domain-containing protein n=1 Tax=Acrobeloides nanus TaxID=290746 RepID=A0A914CRK6_9BILA
MLTPPFTGTSSSSCDADDDCSDGDIDVVHDSPSPKKMRPNILPVNSSYQSTLFNALLLSRQIPFDFSSQIQNIMSVSEEDDELNDGGMDNFSNGERRRGRPRKPDVVEGEDGKIIAKRMYARQYRENMKNRYDDLKKEIDMHVLEKKELRMKLGQLQRLLEECKCIKQPWVLWQNLHTQECVHPLDSDITPLNLSRDLSKSEI